MRYRDLNGDEPGAVDWRQLGDGDQYFQECFPTLTGTWVRGAMVIRVASSLYEVPFYVEMGYRRSTGVRRGWSFEGRGLKIQPMRKSLECARGPGWS
jgi:hypothetical protein